MRLVPALVLLWFVSACVPVVAPQSPAPSAPQTVPVTAPPPPPPRTAVENFRQVIDRVEPVAEAICRERTRGVPCDFQIVVDTKPGLPANAYQTIDRSGRPIIGFTVALIADARNTDELAFVLGHEAAHHIAGHIPRQQETAMTGALVAGILATVSGASDDAIRSAQDFGATIGARRFSKDFELEADALGTEIAFRAGYDPMRGAAFFGRIPDPGDAFLGTHPPNSQRIETVARTLERLR
jgi:Zn-dependent protease with chaperone function